MTWTKFGTEYLTDPDVLSLPRGARLLHIEATIWSNQHGTDGRIPAHVIARFSDEPDLDAAVSRLTEVGLWAADEGAWTLADFAVNQPAAADVERIRERAKTRQRRQRQHQGGDHSLCDARYCHQAASRRDAVSDFGVSHDARTEPVPTRAEKARGRVRVDSGPIPVEPDGSPDRPPSFTEPKVGDIDKHGRELVAIIPVRPRGSR